jgi:hypothetical protein
VRRAKTEIVLRLLKGEELGAVSREVQVPVHELERWRRIFLEGAANGFKRRDTPAAERELKRVQAKVGELTMKLEIVEWFLTGLALRFCKLAVERLEGHIALSRAPSTGTAFIVTRPSASS